MSMMSMSPSHRIMLLECLRENATNMRIEHQSLCERINIALQNSRDSLRRIQNLNQELQVIKVAVNNALASISDPEQTDAEYVVRDLYNILTDNVAASGSNSVFDSVTQCLDTVTESEAIVASATDPVPEKVPDPDSDPPSAAESSAESSLE